MSLDTAIAEINRLYYERNIAVRALNAKITETDARIAELEAERDRLRERLELTNRAICADPVYEGTWKANATCLSPTPSVIDDTSS